MCSRSACRFEAGAQSDLIKLHPNRHSGIWVDTAAGVVFLRLQRRKHRLHGSLLKRQCCCHAVGPQFCMLHRVQNMLQHRTYGLPVFDYGPAAFLKQLRALLVKLSVEGAARATLKCFRAGHATEMSKRGCPLGQILLAGEWRSSAFLRYVVEQEIDASFFLDTVLTSEEADDEP